MIEPSGLRLHPWNRSFAWRTSPPPYRALSRAQVDQFERDGFVVLPKVCDAARIAGLVFEIDRLEAEVDAFLRTQDDHRFIISESGAITFSVHLVARSPALRAFARERFFADVCADLIGPDVNLYWDQAVYKKPEKPRRFPWHQDNGYAFVEPQQYLTFWIALTDATIENGCPVVVPGMHRHGTLAHHYVDPLGWECLRDPDPREVVAAEVEAGGVVVFSSLTPHLTGPNRTDQVRKTYILQYAPSGARVLAGDPSGEPTGSTSADDPIRQFPILRAGLPVEAQFEGGS